MRANSTLYFLKSRLQLALQVISAFVLLHSVAWALPPIPEIPSFPSIQSNGTTYYVDKDAGNDATGDGSSGSPWATIQHGVNRLSAGDTLIMHAGATAYNEEVDVSVAGTSGNWITIKGADGETVEIGGYQQGIDLQAAAKYIYVENLKFTGSYIGARLRQGSAHIVLDNIELDGKSSASYGLWIGDLNDPTGSKHCYFKDVEIHYYTVNGVNLNNGDENLVFDSCISRNNTGDGFTGRANPSEDTPVTDIYVVNCQAYGNGGEGFDLGSNSDSVFKNCIAYDNQGQGFKVWGGINDGDDIWLINCLAYENGWTGINIKNISDADVYIINCTLVNNTTAEIKAKIYNYGSGGFPMGPMHLYLYNNIVMHSETGKCLVEFEHTNAEIKESNNNYFFAPGNMKAFQFRDNQVEYKAYYMPDIGSGKAWNVDTGNGANSFARTTASHNLVDPGFINLANDDYAFKNSSLAVDAGADVGVAEDIFGKQRPQGGKVDIGAFEYQVMEVAIGTPKNFRVVK